MPNVEANIGRLAEAVQLILLKRCPWFMSALWRRQKHHGCIVAPSGALRSREGI
jgi:hypothetical protein